MDVTAFKAICDNILANSSDTSVVSTGLTSLLDAYTVAVADQIQTAARLDDQMRQNDTLRQTNMDLFLRVPVNAAGAEPQPEPEEEKLSFDALFKDGVLK